jgi:hypothetical protein
MSYSNLHLEAVFSLLAAVSGRNNCFTREALVAVREHDFHMFDNIDKNADDAVTLEEWFNFLQKEIAEKGGHKGLPWV